MTATSSASPVPIALAWCLAWGEGRDPQFPLPILQQMCAAIRTDDAAGIPEALQPLWAQVRQFQESVAATTFPKTLAELQSRYPELWRQTSRIGLVYGGYQDQGLRLRVRQTAGNSRRLGPVGSH